MIFPWKAHFAFPAAIVLNDCVLEQPAETCLMSRWMSEVLFPLHSIAPDTLQAAPSPLRRMSEARENLSALSLPGTLFAFSAWAMDYPEYGMLSVPDCQSCVCCVVVHGLIC